MTTSYKAYWFIGLLELAIEESKQVITIRDICIRMLANAWYPVHFFRLNYGVYDQVSISNKFIADRLQLKADIGKEELIDRLTMNEDDEVEQAILHFKRHVLYRFLSPWISYTSDAQVEAESQKLKEEVPYTIDRNSGTIIISDLWFDYFQSNYTILKDYCFYQLSLYLQARNPGVPAILNKLIKPAVRESLQKQREFWNIAFHQLEFIRCIYSDQPLTVQE